MSGLPRTLRNLWRIGPRAYGRQMQYIGDAKAGTFMGEDRYGNKYYENMEEEFPLRTRWVDYHDTQYDASQIEPGWHAWMGYMTQHPPNQDPIEQPYQRVWEPNYQQPNMTATRGSYRPYSTTPNKFMAWKPKAEPRQ